MMEGMSTESLKCGGKQPSNKQYHLLSLPRSYQNIAPRPHEGDSAGSMTSRSGPSTSTSPSNFLVNQSYNHPHYAYVMKNYFHFNRGIPGSFVPNSNAFMTFSPPQEFLQRGSGNENFSNEIPLQSNAGNSGASGASGVRCDDARNHQSNVTQMKMMPQGPPPSSQTVTVKKTNSNDHISDMDDVHVHEGSGSNKQTDLPKSLSLPMSVSRSRSMSIPVPGPMPVPMKNVTSSSNHQGMTVQDGHTSGENYKSAFVELKVPPLCRTEVLLPSASNNRPTSVGERSDSARNTCDDSIDRKKSAKGTKSFPRVKHMLTRIKTDESEAKSRRRFDGDIVEMEGDGKISFEKISSFYPQVPLQGNKRCSSIISSSSLSDTSHSSSPETVPSITEEQCLEKENKRPKTTPSSNNETPLDILCEAVTIAISKQKKAAVKVMESLDRSKSCSCPRSRCIKLYCECFQDGRMCSDKCSCKKCKNTKEESGPNGLRTVAMQNILLRNPFAFHKDKKNIPVPPPSHEGIVCRCVKSQCLKLYCDCFQSGQVCGSFCLCVNCLNTHNESGVNGKRTLARKSCLERKPDAFVKKKKEVGSCSCRNSRYVIANCDYL